ncbi:MAG: serine--tRNA ligase, partial [Pusillimonas sp.]
MLDPNQLRKDMATVVNALARRNVLFDAGRFGQLEARRKAVQVETETLQARRNALAKLIGQRKSKGEDATAEMSESQSIPVRLKDLEHDLALVQGELNEWLMTIPNL